MARRAYTISDDRIGTVDMFSALAEIDKSNVMEIALAFGLPAMRKAWEKTGKKKGAEAIHSLLQAAYEESIKTESAKRRRSR